MDLFLLLSVVLIGVLEGLTEFLPVSSTGHLIVLKEALGVDLPDAFLIAIQLGAILAVCTVYWRRLADTTIGVFRGEATAWRFSINLLVAFLPAVGVGLLAYDFIKSVLLESPATVGTTLVLGGIAILILEKRLERPRVHSVDGMNWRTALGIGVVQCLAMIPGVSRSGATIMGGLGFGLARKPAAEFSFFLAIPTMVAATGYDLYKTAHGLTDAGAGAIAIGFAVAFVAAALVVRAAVSFIERHGFAPFAWYRIGAGGLVLIWLALR
ncbi:undecaprenyl-diphosphate phosphatase [Zavarzinia compransoris]|uniref:undecaprenyl-diphosphate phosphatase n=1 Tax=Zavarzinia marina TaxID=2911065 RepID=UPI001F3DDCE8|nr:undecaprenyl-diphosphate phosphatase [Zavarzinia marina]MCF4165770.1 undecaprenyl-diphosphate phosphatase [Zavarzinia marina]